MNRPSPLQRHLCDQDPAAFKRGFDFAAFWVRYLAAPSHATVIWQAIRDSTGQPFAVTSRCCGLPETAEAEGFMLGVYGAIGLAQSGTPPP